MLGHHVVHGLAVLYRFVTPMMNLGDVHHVLRWLELLLLYRIQTHMILVLLLDRDVTNATRLQMHLLACGIIQLIQREGTLGEISPTHTLIRGHFRRVS